MPLVHLPTSTVKLIGSSQVITSVSSVVKELIENSLDSGATNIEVKLEKHGLEKITVKDDGCGIGKNDALLMCLPNYTSKISSFSDLDSLSSYGFRGEALSSLCNVAQVSVITKPSDDDIATSYTYDKNGQVVCSKISHISKGTIITVTELFKNLPVRKQCMSNSKKAGEELKRVEQVVKSLSMVHPRIKVTLIHNKFLIWQKTSVTNLRQSVMQVISLSIVKQLHHALHNTQQIRLEMMVPKHDCDISTICVSSFAEAFFLFINHRPIRCKEIEKIVYNKFNEFFGVYLPFNKYPISVMALNVPAESLDVNLEPNKTRVYFKNQEEVLEIVSQCLHLYYAENKKEALEQNEKNIKVTKKRKIDNDISGSGTIKVIMEEQIVPEKSEKVKEKLLEGDIMTVDITESSDHALFTSSDSFSNNNVDRMFENFCLEIKNKPLEKFEELVDCKKGTGNQLLDSFPENNRLLEMNNQPSEKCEELRLVHCKSGMGNQLLDSFPENNLLLEMNNKFSEKPEECKPVYCKNSSENERINLFPQNNSSLKTNNDILEKLEECEQVVCKKHTENKSIYSFPENDSLFQTNIQILETVKECEPFYYENSIENKSIDSFPDNNSLLCHAKSLNSKIVHGNKNVNWKIKTSPAPKISNQSINGQTSLLDFIVKEKTEVYLVTKSDGINRESDFSQINNSNIFGLGQVQEMDSKTDILDDSDIKICENEEHSFETRNNTPRNIVETSPTLSQWSRGELTTASGALIKGPCIQTSSVHSPVSQESQTSSNRSVSSQMGCKEMSAFTKFARKMRKQILEENPEMSFIRVAQLLQIKWRQLNDDEKKKYQDIIKCSDSKKEEIQKLQRKQVLTKSADIELEVNMDYLKQLLKSSVESNYNEMQMIAQLESSSLWLCASSSSDISVISVTRMLEAVKFDNYMKNYSLPTKLLEDSIKITSGDFTDQEWNLLISLERSPNGNIKDPRLISNGFIVEIIEGDEEGQLLYVPENISFICLEMIKEILALIQSQGLDASIKNCRPLRVTAFIRSEVMRDCTKSGPPNDHKQVQELFNDWVINVAPHTKTCIHHQLVTYSLNLNI